MIWRFIGWVGAIAAVCAFLVGSIAMIAGYRWSDSQIDGLLVLGFGGLMVASCAYLWFGDDWGDE